MVSDMSRVSEDAKTLTAAPKKRRIPRRLIFMAPLVVFAGLIALFIAGLGLDPSVVPSALLGKPVPEFNLPPIKGGVLGLRSSDLKGKVSLVNVFASWCPACRIEHPIFMKLKARGIVPIHGINYKDKPDDVAKWLKRVGDPYTRTGADINGRVSIDWGVYGVPETFVITKKGRIAYKLIGPVTEKILNEKILPLVRKLQQE